MLQVYIYLSMYMTYHHLIIYVSKIIGRYVPSYMIIISAFFAHQIFCSNSPPVGFLLDVQQLTTRKIASAGRPVDSNVICFRKFYWTSIRRIALLDIQQKSLWMSSRNSTGCLVEQMIWAIVTMTKLFRYVYQVLHSITYVVSHTPHINVYIHANLQKSHDLIYISKTCYLLIFFRLYGMQVIKNYTFSLNPSKKDISVYQILFKEWIRIRQQECRYLCAQCTNEKKLVQ